MFVDIDSEEFALDFAAADLAIKNSDVPVKALLLIHPLGHSLPD